MRIINDRHDIFTAHPSNAAGSHLVGHLEGVTRAELEQTFGSPHEIQPGEGDGKVTTEWVITIDGELATIYDWKRGRAPGMDERITWNIGGFTSRVAITINVIV